MGADVDEIQPAQVIGPAQRKAQKERLAACEARIETGLRSFADVGAALAEIKDSQLYRLDFGTFEGYCEERWELRGKRPYEIMAAAAVVWEISHKKLPDLPVPAIESHAAALAKVPGDRRAEVWAAVIGQTDGRPTAKAVAEAWEALKPPADPHADIRPEPDPAPPRPERARAAPPRPEPVLGSVTAAAETVTTTTSAAEEETTEKKPHVCRFACQGCGKPDTAFSEQAGKLMDELEALRAQKQCGHDAAWHGQAEWLHAQMAAKGFAWDGRQFAKPPASGPAPSACSRGGRHTVARQGDGSTRCGKCHQDLGTAVAS